MLPWGGAEAWAWDRMSAMDESFVLRGWAIISSPGDALFKWAGFKTIEKKYMKPCVTIHIYSNIPSWNGRNYIDRREAFAQQDAESRWIRYHCVWWWELWMRGGRKVWLSHLPLSYVIAHTSRLANLDHNLQVLLIEAGESNLNNPWVFRPGICKSITSSPSLLLLSFSYFTNFGLELQIPRTWNWTARQHLSTNPVPLNGLLVERLLCHVLIS